MIWIDANNKNELEQRYLLRDPSLAFQYDIIMYSPKLFTGFSFDSLDMDGSIIPVAHRVVGIFNGHKISWMERAQSLFRVRDCTEFHFNLVDVESPNKQPPRVDIEAERAKLFDCTGLYMPMPKQAFGNEYLIPYFRSRGFSMNKVDVVPNATKRIKAIQDDLAKLKAKQEEQLDVVVNKARQFVSTFLKQMGVDSPTGHYVLFEGTGGNDFSSTVDVLLGNEDTLDCVLAVNPKWKRSRRFDMKMIQNMFTVANVGCYVDVQHRNVRKYGESRRTVYTMTLVVDK